MEWFKLATSYYLDPQLIAAGEAAEVLFSRAMAYSANAETEGFVPENAPKMLTPSRTKQRVDALVRNGLWKIVEGGYMIVPWTDWQSELDALTARRKADRERKRRQREHEKYGAAPPANTGPSRDKSRDTSRDGHGNVRPPYIELELEEEEVPTELPPAPQLEVVDATNGTPRPRKTKHTGRQEPADTIADEWWRTYTTAQTFPAVRSVIRSAITNGTDTNELRQALDQIGREGKPVAGGTIQFVIGKRREELRRASGEPWSAHTDFSANHYTTEWGS